MISVIKVIPLWVDEDIIVGVATRAAEAEATKIPAVAFRTTALAQMPSAGHGAAGGIPVEDEGEVDMRLGRICRSNTQRSNTCGA